MKVSVSGLVRTGLVVAAGAAVVVGATQAQGSVVLGNGTTPGASRDAATAAVRGASLLCPGPELRGATGVPDLPVGARVEAVTAPRRTLTGVEPGGGPGKVTLGTMPSGALGRPGEQRGVVVGAEVAQPRGVLASATESLAPGLAAAQAWLVPSGDQRALVSAPCTTAGADLWILAGGAAPGRQERLVLTNPGGNAVSADVTLHGPQGALASPNGKGVVVPAHGRTVLLLDAISSTVTAPAVHVVARGGVLGAVVNDLWLDGTRAAGSDDAVPTAAPSRDQVIPAVSVGGGPATLRVAVPGRGEAVVQARALTADGPRALPADGVVRLQGGTVQDIDITRLPAGTVGLQVRADVPVVAAAMVMRAAAGAPSDLAWTSSAPPITGVAGMPLVQPAAATTTLTRQLALTSSADTAVVEVVTVDAAGVETARPVTVQPDSTVGVDVTGATSVWVHRLSGKGVVRAGVVSTLQDAQGVLVTAAPLRDSTLSTTTVGLREVSR